MSAVLKDFKSRETLVDTDWVERLEAALELAKKGETTGGVLVEDYGGSCGMRYSCNDRYKVVGWLEYLKTKLLED